jgi:hypothetical protein
MQFAAMLYTYHFDWRFQVAYTDQGCMFGRVDWREVVQRLLSWRAPKLRLSHDPQHGSVGMLKVAGTQSSTLYHTTGPP